MRVLKFAEIRHAFSTFMLLVGWQEWHPACKETEWWDVVVISGARCRFACSPAYPTATHYLLLQEIQIGFGFTFLVLAHPCIVDKIMRATKRLWYYRQCRLLDVYLQRAFCLILVYTEH